MADETRMASAATRLPGHRARNTNGQAHPTDHPDGGQVSSSRDSRYHAPAEPPELVVGSPIDSFLAARELTDGEAGGTSIILVVEARQTLRDDAVVAAETLAEAGSRPLGLLVIEGPSRRKGGRT